MSSDSPTQSKGDATLMRTRDGSPTLREIDAALMREAAYKDAMDQLKAGRIDQAQAVQRLRRAYHRAELHARGMRRLPVREGTRRAA